MIKKSLGFNAIISGLQKLLSIIFPLITFPYISRILSVSGIGKVNFVTSVISYFILIAGLGINNYAIREGARIRSNKDKLNDFANEMFTINMYSTVFAYLLLFLFAVLTPKLYNLSFLLIIQSTTILGTTIGINWLYSIYEDYVYITIRTLVFQILSLLLVLTLIKNRNDYIVYAFILVLSSVGSNIFNLFRSKKYINLRLVRRTNFKKHIRPILVIFSSAVAISVYVNSDITILGILKGNYEVGLYSTSVKIYNIAKQIMSAMIVVTLPRLSSYISDNNYKLFKKSANTLFKSVILLGLPASIGILLLSKNIIYIIAGQKFIQASASLAILGPTIFFSILSSYETYVLLLPMKRERIQLFATILSAIINFGFNFLLIPFLGINGAAITTLLSEITVFLIEFKIIFENRELFSIFKFECMDLRLLFVGNLGVVIICILSKVLFQSAVLQFLIAVIFSITFYVIVMYFGKFSVLRELKNKED